MDIKEHIEAGHYPVDDKGRPLVPTIDNRTFCVLATDVPSRLPIVGYCTNRPDIISSHSGTSYHFFLPPPPRKVKVTYWGVIGKPSNCPLRLYATEENAKAGQRAHCGEAVSRVVELTGEYEEPWS